METHLKICLFAVMTLLAAMPAIAVGSCENVDFNQNGVIDEADIEAFKFLLGKSDGEDGYLAAADLDGSGSITPVDFQILLSCR